jgi:dTDP-4-dehydrorhamnose reductase
VRVVLTGAGGLVARALVPALERGGHDVLPLTRADADVTDLAGLRHPLASFKPEWVVNLAAYTKVDEAETRADHAYLVNALGARNVALAALEIGAGIVHLSTDYVFEGNDPTPRREYDPVAPRSVYGISKLAGERAVREVHTRHLIVRTAWAYGHGGHHFVSAILKKARAGEPVAVVDDQHGSPTFTHDLAEQLVRLVAAGQFGTYHVTNTGACTWWDLAAFVLSKSNLPAPTRTTTAALGRPAPRPVHSVLSNLLAERVTGSVMPSWQDAVTRYLAEARSS